MGNAGTTEGDDTKSSDLNAVVRFTPSPRYIYEASQHTTSHSSYTMCIFSYPSAPPLELFLVMDMCVARTPQTEPTEADDFTMGSLARYANVRTLVVEIVTFHVRAQLLLTHALPPLLSLIAIKSYRNSFPLPNIIKRSSTSNTAHVDVFLEEWMLSYSAHSPPFFAEFVGMLGRSRERLPSSYTLTTSERHV